MFIYLLIYSSIHLFIFLAYLLICLFFYLFVVLGTILSALGMLGEP